MKEVRSHVKGYAQVLIRYIKLVSMWESKDDGLLGGELGQIEWNTCETVSSQTFYDKVFIWMVHWWVLVHMGPM